MIFKDYYKILGVGRYASDEEIKAACRKLAFEHHPDRGLADSDAIMKEINAAHEVLVRGTRNNKKAEYDKQYDNYYAELRNMYFQRRNHRLKEEWIDTFCKWIESLPYAEELIMYEGGNK